MDFRIKNPLTGNSAHIDEKAQAWGGVEADIFAYLSDVNNLEKFADMSQDAEQLATFLDPFLDNASTYFEAMQKLSDGQVTWTELRKQFGSKVANAIAKIRKLNSEFDSDMTRIDAQDRADSLRIHTKREHALAEVAQQLHHDLNAEIWRHQNKLGDIASRQTIQAERQQIQSDLREKRQSLLDRVKHGSKRGPQEKLNVETQPKDKFGLG